MQYGAHGLAFGAAGRNCRVQNHKPQDPKPTPSSRVIDLCLPALNPKTLKTLEPENSKTLKP